MLKKTTAAKIIWHLVTLFSRLISQCALLLNFSTLLTSCQLTSGSLYLMTFSLFLLCSYWDRGLGVGSQEQIYFRSSELKKFNTRQIWRAIEVNREHRALRLQKILIPHGRPIWLAALLPPTYLTTCWLTVLRAEEPPWNKRDPQGLHYSSWIRNGYRPFPCSSSFYTSMVSFMLWINEIFVWVSLTKLLPTFYLPAVECSTGNKIFGKFGSVRVSYDIPLDNQWGRSWPEGIKLVDK